MKNLELRLVLIHDVILGSSYELRYVEIEEHEIPENVVVEMIAKKIDFY